MALDWNLKSVLKSCAISLTNLWKGNFLIKSSVDFWNLLISLKATVPGLYLWGFFTPPETGADFLAALDANCFLGALPPVDFLAVCLVLAMVYYDLEKCGKKGVSVGRAVAQAVERGAIPRHDTRQKWGAVANHIARGLHNHHVSCPFGTVGHGAGRFVS